MTSRDFCFWLQGIFELGKPRTLDEEQTATIRRHLSLVFKHEIDPSMGGAEHQAELDKVHGPRPKPHTGEPNEHLRPRPPGELVMRC
jgi:hypothetical protein